MRPCGLLEWKGVAAERVAELCGCFAGFFLLLLFELFFELGALLGLDVVALLALGVQLLLGAKEFDEGLFGAIALLKSSPDDAQIAALAVPVAGGHSIEQPHRGLVSHRSEEHTFE